MMIIGILPQAIEPDTLHDMILTFRTRSPVPGPMPASQPDSQLAGQT